MRLGQDPDGQAFSPLVHFGRHCQERPHEFTGLLKGVLADGEVNLGEATFIKQWLEANWDYIGQWPFDVLYERIGAFLADGRLDSEEEKELLGILAAHVGGTFTDRGTSQSSHMLCDDPVPEIAFDRSMFVVTGVFLSGKRRAVEAVIQRLGGAVGGSVTGKTNYLLIGDAGSRDWLMSNYGTKIMAAADRKREGQIIGVVNERNFLLQLQPRARDLTGLIGE